MAAMSSSVVAGYIKSIFKQKTTDNKGNTGHTQSGAKPNQLVACSSLPALGTEFFFIA